MSWLRITDPITGQTYDSRLIDDERVRLCEAVENEKLSSLFSRSSAIKQMNTHELRKLISELSEELLKRTDV